MEIKKIVEVPLSNIDLRGINVRTDLDSPHSQELLQELAESIRVNGLMQPIVLRGPEGHPPYDVVLGQRRFLAHQILDLPSIKASFTDEIDDTQALLLSLSENMLRQELNHADIATAVTKLYVELGRNETLLKEKLGMSTKSIRGYIKIEEQATEKIKKLLADQKINPQDAKRAIDASQGNPEKADALIDELRVMTKYEKQRAMEASRAKPEATVAEIIEKARTPRLEETVILNLPIKVSNALKKASETLNMDTEVLTMNALTTWLINNDFLMD